MFIFKIFRLRKQLRAIKSGVADPSGFVVDQALGMIKGYVIVLAFLTLVVLGLLFVFGWTDLITQSTLFARILFWIIFIPLSLFWIIIITTLRAIKRMIQNLKNIQPQE
ncbi:hypothetical protein COB64_00360 [Candidatus Wolfebacteria bacterium]|nr:MAG: hypothetical protein COB64_00360 [Candidatus Wolfebacteria bacterium]